MLGNCKTSGSCKWLTSQNLVEPLNFNDNCTLPCLQVGHSCRAMERIVFLYSPSPFAVSRDTLTSVVPSFFSSPSVPLLRFLYLFSKPSGPIRRHRVEHECKKGKSSLNFSLSVIVTIATGTSYHGAMASRRVTLEQAQVEHCWKAILHKRAVVLKCRMADVIGSNSGGSCRIF